MIADKSLLKNLALINGEWVGAINGATFEVNNPANNEIIGSVPLMGAVETENAIQAAATAWGDWRKLSAKERRIILRKWFELIMANQEDLSRLMTWEQGKPLAEARGEVAYAAGYIDFYADEALRIYGETLMPPTNDRKIIITREPIGVCAAITPWNFPLAMITRKAAPAMAAGNPIIIKPAEATPLSALAIAELALRAGVPKGVLQVISGDPKAIGATLTKSPIVRKLSFTGSTAVGKYLYAQSADTLKKLSLELGGNAPFIVFDDADIDKAVEGAMASKYRNAGQTCVCANRIYAQAGIYDEFVAKLAIASQALKIGSGFDDGVNQGPLINDAAVEKVETLLNDAIANGAEIVLGGKRIQAKGAFFEPTILKNMNSKMRMAKEEIFGPVAPVFKFETEEEVISLANDTEFGLASYFYGRDVGRVFRVAEALEYGMVGINTGVISTELAPFGGVKNSGFGREGSHHGMDDYLVTKYLAVAGL